ncbi:hypothetical protein [Longimicrobium sp.]|uniref:hypothetical protein n=1 Tax=Longimicrobium sp. TaxID=2029185 RepID=UPI002C94BC6A|nr:hypothetical protein [Longimicrobium sp.]HSU17726.1 hypothetical protein [Longimicrobium sp.]
MNLDSVIKLLVICSVIVLPAIAVTARFALKPIVDAILRLKEGGILPEGAAAGTLAGEVRLARAELQSLRDEVAAVRDEMARLQEAESFHRSLGYAPGTEPPALPAGQES